MTLRMTMLAAAAALILPAAANATMVAALVGDNTLALVDTAAGKIARTVQIEGLQGKVLGIDVRPADKLLYAVAEDGTVATVDPMTGKATVKSKLETITPKGVAATIDFNPVPDRLRIIGSDGTNLRANVDDGKVATDGMLNYGEADANKGMKPMVVTGAYINSVAGAKETGLFNIDAGLGAVVKQAPPNDGVLNTIGMTGVKAQFYALDVLTDSEGKNTAFLMADDTLYTVDLSTGMATKAATVAGAAGVRDIAILPGM